MGVIRQQTPNRGSFRDLAQWRTADHGVELLSASFRSHVYERHVHDTYAIGVTLKGVQRFWCRGAVRDGTPGDIVAINPGEAHDGKSGTDDGYAYRMMYLPVEWMRGVVDDAAGRRADEIFVRNPILEDPPLASQLCAAWESMADPSRASAGDALLYEATLALVVRHAGLRPADRGTTDKQLMRRIRDYLHSRVEDGVRVQELADVAGISRFQLTRQFQRVFGLPLHAFHLHLKLEEAKRRLLRGIPIAQVATDLGFADQSHFHRRFKGTFGVTPDSWRRSITRP